MANVIYVKPDKLEKYNEELQKTSVMLDNILKENEELINKTSHHINTTIDLLDRKKIEAKIDLEQARASLATAIAANVVSDEKEDLSYYKESVNRAIDRLEKITDACKDARKVKDNYLDSSEQYKQDEKNYYQNYRDILNKGKAILEKYIELVRCSTNILPGG